MFGIKRLHLFVLQSFIPIFLMTFFISNFILVMQLVWRVAEYIIGKGIELTAYLEFLLYASATMVPLSLPLAVLLASLMTFGNFGEKLELLSMKSAGISLYNIMRPLIVLMVLLSAFSFVFQDKVLPVVQMKLQSLTVSMQQKSPALSIPQGAFYSDIEGMTIYVKEKDTKKKMLKDIMIYDFSQGFDNAAVTLADSGLLRLTEDKLNLVLTLYHGEGFSNFDKQQAATRDIPYRRESFREKEIIVPFDNNFNRIDESQFQSSHLSKKNDELRQIIDSVGSLLDSTKLKKKVQYTEKHFMGRNVQNKRELISRDSIDRATEAPLFNPNIDSLFLTLNKAQADIILDKALKKVNTVKSEFEYQEIALSREHYQFRRSGVEYYRRYALSIACLVFFFIGAPLGAIIRKGGIGMPAVVSVVLFIAYYLVDTAGQKLVRNGSWDAMYGMFLSTAALLPLGIFLTYKSANDSAIFNLDSYIHFFKRIFNIKFTYRYLRYVFKVALKNKHYAKRNKIKQHR